MGEWEIHEVKQKDSNNCLCSRRFAFSCYFINLTTLLLTFQRIRELEDRIDLQKRQIKEIEEKVVDLQELCRPKHM